MHESAIKVLVTNQELSYRHERLIIDMEEELALICSVSVALQVNLIYSNSFVHLSLK